MRNPVRSVVAIVAASLMLASCSQSQDGAATAASGAAAKSLVGGVAAVPTVLVLDSSGSMAEAEGDGNRMDGAKKAATGLIDALPDDAVLGLVAYGTSTGSSDGEKLAGCVDVKTLQRAVALDRKSVNGAVSGLQPSGFTPIGASLRQAADLLPRDGEAAIVLLSDGEDTCAPPPPCEVARELKAQRPGLTISTVGFKTANEELSCIASATGGLYLTADNTEQLISRLVAAQNASGNAEALTPTGLRGVELGQSVDEIRAAHPDFPGTGAGRADGGQVVIVWMDCDWVFEGGALMEIRPRAVSSTGGDGQPQRNVDGLETGSTVSKAVGLYGDAVEQRANPDGTTTSLFTASEQAGTAWKVGHQDETIKTIYLCKCLPGDGTPTASAPTDKVVGATTVKRFHAFGPDGSPTIGTVAPATYGFGGCRPMDYGPQTEGLFSCGPHLDLTFCSKADDRAYCPVPSATTFETGPSFETDTVQWNPEAFGTATSGQLPWAMELDGGSTCRFGSERGVMRDGYSQTYWCGDDDSVWAPIGGATITESAGGWTVMVGGERGALRRVTVRTAVLLTGD